MSDRLCGEPCWWALGDLDAEEVEDEEEDEEDGTFRVFMVRR